MPGYEYNGANRDAHLPWPEPPEPAPKPPKPARRKRKPPSPCGTDSAYGRHRKHGEPIDDACRKAHSEAGKRRYQARKART